MLRSDFKDYKVIAGADEAGRGCLSGPVVAAAVILPLGFECDLINDSKKLTHFQREEAFQIIIKEAISYSITEIDAQKIDEINILNASILAMQESFKKLNVIPDCQLIDGNRFKKFHDIPYYTIIKGDGIQMQIAAASILAKVHRDHLMNKLHEELPHYKWNKNMGYPTKKHLEALEEFGVTKYHRLSYKPVLNILQKQITLFDGV